MDMYGMYGIFHVCLVDFFYGINVGKYTRHGILWLFFQGLVKFLHKFGYILESLSHDGSMGRTVYLRIHDLVDIL